MSNSEEFIAQRRFISEFRREEKWRPLREYFAAARTGNEKIVKKHLDAGVSVNAVDPISSFTALHFAAARRGYRMLETLLNQPDIDHIVRDRFGRLPSELAGRFSEDPELADRLRTLELWQAQNQGVKLTYRPRLSPPKAGL